MIAVDKKLQNRKMLVVTKESKIIVIIIKANIINDA
jgi:hypothetical protein